MKLRWSKVNSFNGNYTSPLLTYYRACPVCGGIESRLVCSLEDFQFYSDSADLPKRINIRQNQCAHCYAIFLNPCFSDLGYKILFAEAGQSYGSTAGRPQELVAWMSQRGLLHSGARVLDVGCYDGSFLAQLPDNLQRTGVDIDRQSIETGRSKFGDKGIELVCGEFANFQYSGSPDTITMFHVLEHLPNPVAALRKLRQIAHGNTRLVVEVPILEKGATNDINGFFSVQHTTHFSRTSFVNCLAISGWKVIDCIAQDTYNGFRIIAEPAEELVEIEGYIGDSNALNRYLSSWYRSLADVDEILVSLPDFAKCVIWGGGAHSEFLYQATSFFLANARREYMIVDRDPCKEGKSWRGIRIHSPEILQSMDLSETLLLISSYGNQEMIAREALALGVPEKNIVRLYQQTIAY